MARLSPHTRPMIARTIARNALLVSTLLVACSARQFSQAPTPLTHLSNATQLLVVTTPGWDSTTGQLRRYVRNDTNAPWQRTGDVIPIVVGKTGLAWGVGFDGEVGPHKKEGDGRSPAGIFPIGKAFGFAPADSMRSVRLGYVQLTPSIECVDDTASVHYNTVVDRNEVQPVDWHSSERMRRVSQYRLGFVVDYNSAPAVKARGSCIFFHIWGGPQSTTVGCTAMEAGELEKLLVWLDPRARPVVVQLTSLEYGRARAVWKLPLGLD
jgi:L,D-peptidoglycan transpeptidase YkuD (ErfK/YbiS/YcfS/YnhG family)